MLADTHAHLYWESFKQDFNEVIKRALDAGITTIINVGVDVEKSKEALKQVEEVKWPSGMSVYSTIGIHPHEAVNLEGIDGLERLEENIRQLEQLYKTNPQKVVAVGECGLDDLDVDEKAKKLQRKLFQAQIDLAKKLNLPLIVHCRDDRSKNPNNIQCWDEVIEMTKNHFGIYHCYSGLPQTTNYILQTTNFLISFAGNVTYPKNDYLRDAAKIIPLDRIVIETDCPFLPPQSKRGQRNEPANVKEIAQAVADLKGISLEQVAYKISENFKKLL